ncbi:MAG TPA: hydroxymethylpyrimidine/phosphomethylpyrimidine kinase, partial [Synergistaceae bacterium]|nr:hydroxymethylpyrimidine/phosphomethylpyrimidine kinase [Synergistaceae bacterium]
LLPLAEIITPNIPEAEVLSGIRIRDREGMKEAARIITRSTGTNILIKGG